MGYKVLQRHPSPTQGVLWYSMVSAHRWTGRIVDSLCPRENAVLKRWNLYYRNRRRRFLPYDVQIFLVTGDVAGEIWKIII